MFIIRRFIKSNLNFIFITIVSSSMVFSPYILGLIGLSSIGPISGGLFATMQGAGIVSGSLMAMIQSFAMSGWVVVMQFVGATPWVIVFIKNYFMKYWKRKILLENMKSREKIIINSWKIINYYLFLFLGKKFTGNIIL